VVLDLHWRLPATREEPWSRRACAFATGGAVVDVRSANELVGDLSTHVVVHHAAIPKYWPRHLLDLKALRAHGATLEGAGARERVATWISDAVARGVARDPEGARHLARHYVFPRAGGHPAVRLATRLVSEAKTGELGRAVWPSAAFLRARGETRIGRWRRIVASAVAP
jgi:hypothetical protein